MLILIHNKVTNTKFRNKWVAQYAADNTGASDKQGKACISKARHASSL